MDARTGTSFVALLAAVLGAGAAGSMADTPPEPHRFAYITNQGSETVSVVDTAALASVSTIPVPGRPAGIALSPDQSEAFVTAPEARDVAVIDTRLRQVVRRIPMGLGPLGIAVHPETGFLYVADWYSSTLRVADPLTGSVLFEIPVGESPSGVAISPDGRLAVTADRDSDRLSIIDLSTHTVRATVKVGTRPFGVTLNRDGTRAYTANVGSNDVSVVDVVAGQVAGTIAVGRRPYAVALGDTTAGGRGFVTDQYGGTVSVFDTASLAVIATIEACDHPEGIAFDAGRKVVYVACWGDNTLVTIDAETLMLARKVAVGDGPRAFGAFLGR